MIVYLSCDSQNDFFFKIVKESVNTINRSIDNAFELIYPPKKIGKDTGTVRGNILQIQQADLVIFDVTPKLSDDIESYNAGVMIEFGVVLDLENPLAGYPWGGTIPKPNYKVFCNSKFQKSKMTPIINETSISSYEDHAKGEGDLRTEILKILTAKLKEKADFKTTVGSISPTEGKVNPRNV